MGRRGRMPEKPVRCDEERDELVLSHLEVPPASVRNLWRGHHSVRALGFDDAVQVANLGLLRAASLWKGEGRFGAYAFASCRDYVMIAARRGVPVGPKQGPWNLVPFLNNFSVRGIRRVPGRMEGPIPEPHPDWLRLLAAMPDGLEKKFLEARASGLTCREAAALCGCSGWGWEGLLQKSFKLARSVGKEIGL